LPVSSRESKNSMKSRESTPTYQSQRPLVSMGGIRSQKLLDAARAGTESTIRPTVATVNFSNQVMRIQSLH
jgi:hypothetical protein